MIAGIVVLAVLAALGALLRVRRARLLRLQWPRHLGYHAFNNAVNVYLKHHGWAVNYMPIAQHKKIVRRADDRVRIYCQSNADEITRSKVKDLAAEALSSKPELLVCFTSRDLDDTELMAAAASGRVLITSYKALAVFGSSRTGQFATFDAMRRTHLERLPGT